jgi:DNA polymerase elongation subunit (family B)
VSAEPRIIIWDLETCPNLTEALEVWTQLSNYPGQTLKGQVQSILCFGWKVFGSAESEVKCAWDFPSWADNVNDDLALVSYAREVLSSADAIITQNGRRFDYPVLQTRLLKHDLEPLDPRIPHIDTKTASRGNLSFISNSLNNMGRFLLDEMKMDHEGWGLWVRTMRRDPEAAEIMKEYCRQDVLLLEKLYRKLRPFLKQIPNHNLFSPLRENSCPSCGSTRLKSNGKRFTSARAYRRYICLDCRTWCRTDLKDELPR